MALEGHAFAQQGQSFHMMGLREKIVGGDPLDSIAGLVQHIQIPLQRSCATR